MRASWKEVSCSGDLLASVPFHSLLPETMRGAQIINLPMVLCHEAKAMRPRDQGLLSLKPQGKLKKPQKNLTLPLKKMHFIYMHVFVPVCMNLCISSICRCPRKLEEDIRHPGM